MNLDVHEVFDENGEDFFGVKEGGVDDVNFIGVDDKGVGKWGEREGGFESHEVFIGVVDEVFEFVFFFCG